MTLSMRNQALAAMLLLATATMTACGSGQSGSQPSASQAVTKSAPLYKELPAKQREAGKILVGSDISYAPM